MLARNRAIDHLRSRVRRTQERERPIEAAYDHAHPDLDPEAAAVSENQRRFVRKALEDLAPEQLEVLQMAFFKGLSHNEIAEATGIPLGTIKSRIRAGMMRMRELLGSHVGAF